MLTESPVRKKPRREESTDPRRPARISVKKAPIYLPCSGIWRQSSVGRKNRDGGEGRRYRADKSREVRGNAVPRSRNAWMLCFAPGRCTTSDIVIAAPGSQGGASGFDECFTKTRYRRCLTPRVARCLIKRLRGCYRFGWTIGTISLASFWAYEVCCRSMPDHHKKLNEQLVGIMHVACQTCKIKNNKLKIISFILQHR